MDGTERQNAADPYSTEPDEHTAALGFTLHIAAHEGVWPDGLTQALQAVPTAKLRGVFALAARCAQTSARAEEETAQVAREEGRVIERGIRTEVRKLFSVPADQRSAEWNRTARQLLRLHAQVRALPQHYECKAQRDRSRAAAFTVYARRPWGVRSFTRPRESRCSVSRPSRARKAAARGRTRAGPADDDGDEPPGEQRQLFLVPVEPAPVVRPARPARCLFRRGRPSWHEWLEGRRTALAAPEHLSEVA